MRFFLSSLFSLCLAFALAQTDNKADSLINVISTTNIDSIKVKTLNQLGRHYTKSDPALAARYIKEGMELATQRSLPGLMGMLYISMGHAYLEKGSYDSAKQFLQQAVIFGKKNNTPALQIRALSLIGFINTRNAEYTEAASNLFKALEMSEATKDSTAISNTCNSLCALYYDQSNFLKALFYGEKALAIILRNGSEASKGGSYLNVGLIYADMGNEIKAAEYYKKAVAILQKANAQLSVATAYGNLSLLRMNSINETISYLLFAKKIWDEFSPEHPNAIGNTGNLGYAYLRAVQDSNFVRLQAAEGIVKDKSVLLGRAGLYLNEAYKKCKELNLDKDLLLFTGQLAEVEQAKSNYQLANKYLNEFIALDDSIFSQENKNSIAAEEGGREVAIRDKQIELNNISIAAQKKIRLALIAGLLLLLVIGSLLFVQSRTRRRTNTTLLKLNSELDEANKVKARFFGIISHDLRSPIASLVSFLNLQQEAPELFTKAQAEKHRATLSSSAESLLETMEGMLQWSKSQMENFKPRISETSVEGLFQYIRSNFPGDEHYKISFENPEQLVLASDVDYLKTIMHNLTVNSIKALQADREGLIQWKTFRKDGKTILSITDNGPGVDELQLEALYNNGAAVNSKNGLGLHLVRDLAHAINCAINFSSKRGAGTTFQLVLG